MKQITKKIDKKLYQCETCGNLHEVNYNQNCYFCGKEICRTCERDFELLQVSPDLYCGTYSEHIRLCKDCYQIAFKNFDEDKYNDELVKLASNHCKKIYKLNIKILSDLKSKIIN